MFDKIITGVKEILSVITITKAICTVVVLGAVTLMYLAVMYPQKAAAIIQPASPKGVELVSLSKESVAAAEDFVKGNKHVQLMYVVAISQRQNRRTSIARFFNEVEAQKLIEAHDKKFGRDPISPYMTEANVVQNTQMLTLQRGDTVCGPTNESGLLMAYPELADVFKSTCRIPIPPMFGQLAGYIAVHSATDLQNQPAERDRLREQGEILALRIFATDVRKDPTLFEKLQ